MLHGRLNTYSQNIFLRHMHHLMNLVENVRNMRPKTRFQSSPKHARCYVCGENDVTKFTKDKTRSNGYSSTCKACAKLRTRGKMKHRKTYIDHIKSFGCQLCSESTPCVIDMHHVEKAKYSSSGRSRIGWKDWYEDVSKCVFICANCHRKVHAGLITVNVDKCFSVEELTAGFEEYLKTIE